MRVFLSRTWKERGERELHGRKQRVHGQGRCREVGKGDVRAEKHLRGRKVSESVSNRML